MLVISEDLVKLQENLAIALQDPKVIQSLKKKKLDSSICLTKAKLLIFYKPKQK